MKELKVFQAQTPFGLLDLIEDDIVSKTLAEGNHWNEHVYDALESFLGGGDGAVIDVGANVGALALRFAQHDKLVIAFEPHPTLVRCLKQNALRLGFTNLVPVAQGLYSRKIQMAARGSWDGESPSSWTWLEGEDDELSPQVTAWPAGYTHYNVNAIKVDAQGADLHALIGLKETIERDHPRIVFEFEPALSKLHGHTWEDYTRQLEAWGYDLRALGEGDWFAEPKG